MKKHLIIVLAFGALVTTFSSCKKAATTDLSILTGHKWALTSALETFSDSGTISHNLISVNTSCLSSSVVEFHDYTPNDPTRLGYIYTTYTNCPGGASTPSIQEFDWNIDQDNKNMDFEGLGNLLNGWYSIATLNGSQLVITFVGQQTIGFTQGGGSIYDTYTETFTFTAQ